MHVVFAAVQSVVLGKQNSLDLRKHQSSSCKLLNCRSTRTMPVSQLAQKGFTEGTCQVTADLVNHWKDAGIFVHDCPVLFSLLAP